MKNLVVAFMLFFSSAAQAEEKTFSWLWHQELKPTITNSFDSGGQLILLVGAGTTVTARQYDQTVYKNNLSPDKLIMDKDTADIGAYLGSGGPGIAIALTQLWLDPQNGLAHSKALALTAASHITMASLIGRERPSGRDYLSFPSGHASSSYATATSLAYAYGYRVGIPAFALATFVAASRVSENIHWTSDVVAGAALGIYWGRASALNTGKSDYNIVPLVGAGFTGLSFHREF